MLKHTKRNIDVLNIMIGTVTEFIHLFPKPFFLEMDELIFHKEIRKLIFLEILYQQVV